MIKLISSLLIIIIFIQKIKTLSEFKAIKLDNGNIIVINQKGIYVYDKNLKRTLIKNFDPSLIISDIDIKNISFFNYLSNIVFILKNNLYVIFNNFHIIPHPIIYNNCQTSFIKKTNQSNFIFTTQCIRSDDYFVLQYINVNQLLENYIIILIIIMKLN